MFVFLFKLNYFLLTILLVQSTLDEKDSQINTLIKTKVEEFQVGNQFSMLQKLLEQKHKQVYIIFL